MKDYSKFVGKKWVYVENDCIAVVSKIMLEVFNIKIHEIVLPTINEFCEISKIFEREALSDNWRHVEKPTEKIVALFYNKRSQPFHIGLCVDNQHVIHCPGCPKNPGETMIERLCDMPKTVYKRVEFYEYNPN